MEEEEELTAAATPKRRVIKLTSIKELRTEITENTHKGEQKAHTIICSVKLTSSVAVGEVYDSEYVKCFLSRSSGNAAETLVRGLRQPPVDSDPASHQAVPAQHH